MGAGLERRGLISGGSTCKRGAYKWGQGLKEEGLTSGGPALVRGGLISGGAYKRGS